MNPDVDEILRAEQKWQAEFRKLREILLGCSLTEEVKWGQPCYTLDGNNVVLMHGFKEYCALLFMKGALLNDDKGLLIQQTEQVQASRQIRFTLVEEIVRMEQDVKAYVQDAIRIEKSGLKVELKKTSDFTLPEELQKALRDDPALNEAFHALTPGRQRAYILHVSQAKQSKTRDARIEKNIPRILDGLGLDD